MPKTLPICHARYIIVLTENITWFSNETYLMATGTSEGIGGRTGSPNS